MKAETKILRLVAPENGGPRNRVVLDEMAKRYGEGAYLIDYMIAKGSLVKYSDRRYAKWGLPRRRLRVMSCKPMSTI